MRPERIRLPGAAVDRTYPPLGCDPIALFFDNTIGGTTLVGAMQEEFSPGYDPTGACVVISSDVIYEYERRIAELRLEVLHYKRMVARLMPAVRPSEDYEAFPVMPLDGASTRLVNSILEAQIPSDAMFRDFEEGEL